MKIYSLLKSFKYAFSGIMYCIYHERNMRIHLCALIYIFYFSRFYDFSKGETIGIILICGLVPAFEVVNTAVETLTDRVSTEWHDLAKAAKDTAAGAVLIVSIVAVIIAYNCFWNVKVFKYIYEYHCTHIISFIAMIISLICTCIFIGSAVKRGGE